jgi:hypothetical protein
MLPLSIPQNSPHNPNYWSGLESPITPQASSPVSDRNAMMPMSKPIGRRRAQTMPTKPYSPYKMTPPSNLLGSPRMVTGRPTLALPSSTMSVATAFSNISLASSPQATQFKLMLPSINKTKNTVVDSDLDAKYARLDRELAQIDFDDVTVTTLKDLLRERNIPCIGKKTVLIDRLKEHMNQNKLRAEGKLAPEVDPRHPLFHELEYKKRMVLTASAAANALLGCESPKPYNSINQAMTSFPDAGSSPNDSVPNTPNTPVSSPDPRQVTNRPRSTSDSTICSRPTDDSELFDFINNFVQKTSPTSKDYITNSPASSSPPSAGSTSTLFYKN